jgi:hypothetical protein
LADRLFKGLLAKELAKRLAKRLAKGAVRVVFEHLNDSLMTSWDAFSRAQAFYK